MSPWLNNITFGNPFDEMLPYLKKGHYDSIVEELYKFPFPSNDCEATQAEIRDLVELQNSPEQQDERKISRFVAYDEDLSGIYKKYCNEKIEQNLDELIDELIEVSKYIITKLKYRYQRPRPYQLAQYYKARLFPYNSKSANTPSYPSGHAFQSELLTEVIGSKFPEHYSFLKRLANDVTQSRMYLGLHYESDCDFALQCVNALTTSKEFTAKYGL